MVPHCILPSCTCAGRPAATIALLLWLHFDAGGWMEPWGTCSVRSRRDSPDVPSAAVASLNCNSSRSTRLDDSLVYMSHMNWPFASAPTGTIAQGAATRKHGPL